MVNVTVLHRYEHAGDRTRDFPHALIRLIAESLNLICNGIAQRSESETRLTFPFEALVKAEIAPASIQAMQVKAHVTRMIIIDSEMLDAGLDFLRRSRVPKKQVPKERIMRVPERYPLRQSSKHFADMTDGLGLGLKANRTNVDDLTFSFWHNFTETAYSDAWAIRPKIPFTMMSSCEFSA